MNKDRLQEAQKDYIDLLYTTTKLPVVALLGGVLSDELLSSVISKVENREVGLLEVINIRRELTARCFAYTKTDSWEPRIPSNLVFKTNLRTLRENPDLYVSVHQAAIETYEGWIKELPRSGGVETWNVLVGIHKDKLQRYQDLGDFLKREKINIDQVKDSQLVWLT